MSLEVPLVLAIVIAAFVLLPFSLLAVFLFSKAITRSFEDWGNLRTVSNRLWWGVLFAVKVGAIVLYTLLVYWSLRVLF